MLLKHRADPTIADSRGSNCFHLAAQNKDHKTMQLLCRWFSDSNKDKTLLDVLNYEGISPMSVYTYIHTYIRVFIVLKVFHSSIYIVISGYLHTCHEAMSNYLYPKWTVEITFQWQTLSVYVLRTQLYML